ncbi:MAG: hypothetical protein MJ076_04345 [Clostridia bacterium]|nr:hypothetical protein [Clostridia bacterium]
MFKMNFKVNNKLKLFKYYYDYNYYYNKIKEIKNNNEENIDIDEIELPRKLLLKSAFAEEMYKQSKLNVCIIRGFFVIDIFLEIFVILISIKYFKLLEIIANQYISNKCNISTYNTIIIFTVLLLLILTTSMVVIALLIYKLLKNNNNSEKIDFFNNLR